MEVVFGLALYFLPTILCLIRKRQDSGPMFLLNFFFAWTIIGWLILLVMVCRGEAPVKRTDDLLFEAKGLNGIILLMPDRFTIVRRGMTAALTQGAKGDKDILVSRLSSVQFKQANGFTNGYIQFAFMGGLEAKGGLFQAGADENTVMFTKKQMPVFEELRQRLTTMMANASHDSKPNRSGSWHDLEKLGELRDKGILTAEEFAIKKKQPLEL